MAKIEIKTPALGESISEATVAKWLKKSGEVVKVDEPILELETEKVTLEISSPSSGVLSSIVKPEGETVGVGDLLGIVEEGAIVSGAGVGVGTTAGADATASHGITDRVNTSSMSSVGSTTATGDGAAFGFGSGSSAGSAGGSGEINNSGNQADTRPETRIETKKISSLNKEIIINLPPAVSRMVKENNLNPSDIAGTGKHNQITKGDVINYMESSIQGSGSVSQGYGTGSAQVLSQGNGDFQKSSCELSNLSSYATNSCDGGKEVERVKMSRLRKTIAARLKESQNTAAILTTFNEIDMQNVMNLESKFKDDFEKNHKVKLGFMSFFVKATVNALKEIPAVNAEIEGDYLVYKNYYDIGVAVGTEQGLVVPVIRNCDKLSFAGVEKEIAEYGKKAREGKLSMSDMSGGTFTISNGGVYGSLLSTPIINPPQSGILGMHKIQERPVVVNGKIEIRPMMYIALSYDHRIIDGKEAVTFLIRIKQAIEDPERLLLGL